MKALLLIKKFFSIEEKFYRFEIFDVTSILIIINVVLIILGIRFASIFWFSFLYNMLWYEYKNKSTYQFIYNADCFDCSKYILFILVLKKKYVASKITV